MLGQLAIIAFVAAAAAAPGPIAQNAPSDTGIAPNDTGRGIERGLTAVNSSAQTGMLTILRGAGSPRIQITVDGSRGHAESVTLVRGRTCPEALSAPNVAVLGTLHAGQLMATSPIAFDHLMSGNPLHALLVRNNTPNSRAVSCGHIYLSSLEPNAADVRAGRSRARGGVARQHGFRPRAVGAARSPGRSRHLPSHPQPARRDRPRRCSTASTGPVTRRSFARRTTRAVC